MLNLQLIFVYKSTETDSFEGHFYTDISLINLNPNETIAYISTTEPNNKCSNSNNEETS